MKKAIFPGSFDPFTIGHKDILDQALNIFDEIIIAVGENPSKSCMFSLNDRISFIEKSLETNSKISIESYSNLTINFSNLKYVYFISSQNFSHVSSTLVKDIINYGGQYEHLLPFKLKN